MKRFNFYYAGILFTIILLGVAGWWLTSTYLEWEKPRIALSEPVEFIGQQKTLDIRFTDGKSGLRNICASIIQDQKRHPLFSTDFPRRGTKEKSLSCEINVRDLKLRDGEAVLEIAAVDYSVLKNTEVLNLKVNIDTVPPQIFLISSSHNINPGGACLSIYKLSKEPVRTGVQVDSDFFPGYAVTIDGKTCYASFYAIPTDVRNTTRINVVMEDKGGNKSSVSVPFFIRNVKKFRADTVTLPDSFLEQKMPEFQQREPQLRGKSLVETFVYVNEQMRAENNKTIQSICLKTSPKMLWQGPFLRMKNSAPMAMFGDYRTYRYAGKAIGNSVHLGVDLASTAHASVEAANSGIILFTGYLGIYGNAVIIDHGLGLSSLYGHMDSIAVKEGQSVRLGDVIGNTGATGFAGGDHLHFSTLIGGKFVNPVEWWDPHWIKDNVAKKVNVTVP
ncbi:MAG: M23 family metallopeptidase [Syntrophales bacterium]